MKARVLTEGEVEVGDYIRTENWYGRSTRQVTRVTKTMSCCKDKDRDFEYRYKRKIGRDMAVPYVQYNQTTYTVLRPIEQENEDDSKSTT